MARPPATRALQLLLALGWIFLTSLTFPLMNGDPLNWAEDSGLVMTGGPTNQPWPPQPAFPTIEDSLHPAPDEFFTMRHTVITKLPDDHMPWVAILVLDKQEIQSPTMVIVVPLLCSVAFLVGLPANILALWVLIFHTQKAPSTILLINLTVLDVLLLLMLPFRIIYYFAGLNWFFGEPLCRLVMALINGSMNGSVLTLAFISIDRYIALVHPYSALTLRSHRTSLAMSVSVWVVVLLTMLPVLLFRQSYQLNDPPIIACYDAQPTASATSFYPYVGLFGFCFSLTLLVTVFCQGVILKTLLSRGHRYSHAACLTTLVLLVLLACFFPSNILLLLYYINKKYNLYVPYVVSRAFSCFGPCIDPFIYNYVSDDFRDKVLRVLCCHRAGQQVSSNNSGIHLSSSSQSRSTMLSKFWGQMKMFCPKICQEV